MNLVEINHALKQLRLSGMADSLEARLRQAQAEQQPPIDIVSALVSDELLRRQDRLLSRRIKQAGFRDADRTLDTFDFDFNKKMNRQLVFELATGRFVTQREDALFLGPPGTGKSHLAQALGRAAIAQGHRILYREAHVLLEELADAILDNKRKEHLAQLASVPLLIIDDLGMRKLPATAAEDLLELDPASLRARLDPHHLQPSRRRLGKAPRRHRRRRSSARPHAPPRATSSSAARAAGAPALRPTCTLTTQQGNHQLRLGRSVGRFSAVAHWPLLRCRPRVALQTRPSRVYLVPRTSHCGGELADGCLR